LSTSLAKAGRKVLLIDGDLRKPDIAMLMHLSHRRNGLQELLAGEKIENVVCRTSLGGFDVLTAASCNPYDIYEWLTQKRTASLIEIISQMYDHIIIDSPPALAVPDAFLWAKIADAVILTSLAGRTEGEDLKETHNRFVQINVKVLGTVLNNVPHNYGYNRYGYGYYASVANGKNNGSKSRKKTVPLLMQEQISSTPAPNS
jgi:capsular exopolysaccharide synthesis family protein